MIAANVMISAGPGGALSVPYISIAILWNVIQRKALSGGRSDIFGFGIFHTYTEYCYIHTYGTGMLVVSTTSLE